MRQWMILALLATAGVLGCQGTAMREVQPDCAGVPSTPAWEDTLLLYQGILDKYLNEEGLFGYASFLADTGSKNHLLAFLCFVGDFPASKLTNREKRLEFYINSHNACVIQAACEYYPFLRWRQKNADWKRDLRFRIAGEMLTLEEMEQRCAPQEDWRIPFALTGPDLGSPSWSATVYKSETLSEQLDLAVTRYLGGCAGLQVDYARKKVLFGDRVWERRTFFLDDYQKKYGVRPSLLSAIIPWAPAKTQRILSDLAGYGSDELPRSDRLNDIPKKEQENSPEKEVFLPCGCT